MSAQGRNDRNYIAVRKNYQIKLKKLSGQHEIVIVFAILVLAVKKIQEELW